MNRDATLAHLQETTNLADAGNYRCRYCRHVFPLTDGIVVTWGGTVFFALCPNCFSGKPISISESTLKDGRRGIKVGFMHESDHPQIQIVRGEHEINQFMAEKALAKKQRMF